MDPADVMAAWEVAERHLKAAYGDKARIVRQAPMYPTSAPATQIEPTLPLEIWVFDAERSDGQAGGRSLRRSEKVFKKPTEGVSLLAGLRLRPLMTHATRSES